MYAHTLTTVAVSRFAALNERDARTHMHTRALAHFVTYPTHSSLDSLHTSRHTPTTAPDRGGARRHDPFCPQTVLGPVRVSVRDVRPLKSDSQLVEVQCMDVVTK